LNSRTARRQYQVYVWAVFAGAMVTLVALSEGMAGLGMAIDSQSYVALWATMILVAAMSPLPLPWGTATASLTTALDLAAILLFGPAVACWVGVLSRLVSNATQRWTPLLPSVLGLGQIVLAVGASGTIYEQLGGRFGMDMTVSVDQVPPLLGAAAVYVVIKGLIGGTGNAFAAGSARARAFRSWFDEHLAGDLIVLPVGPLLALTQVRIGPVGVALFLLPLLFARYVCNLWAQTKSAHLHMVRVLMSAVDAADPFTRDHSYRVSRMTLRVGRHLGLRAAALEELEFAALLHDIGRTAIQRDVLVKRGRLTDQEMLLLQVHPKIGADLLAGLRFFPCAAEIVHAHHEQPDGKGYPRGLAGEAVPLGSRIIMAVAAFDAMTSDRPYRRGLSPDEALEELLAHSGTQFFPDVVEALIHLYASGTLFAEFDDTHLDRYRDGHEHSRAVEAHLKHQGNSAGVPEKAGARGAASKKRTVAIPVIELLSAEPAARKLEQTIPLKARGTWNLMVAGQSDLGCERKNNEDSFGVFKFEDASRGCLLVLADGMGGALAGEVASRLAVDTVGEAYEQWKKKGQPRDALAHAIQSANRSVNAQASSDSQFDGMGTTCTVAAIVGLELTLGHVGDSRAYLIRKGAIEQLTQDHTLAGELARVAGSRGVAVPERSSHVLTRCIGAQPDVQVDVSPKPIHLEDGARLVLCSDGLSNVVEPEEILELVTADTSSGACDALIELARARGGPDNITVIVAGLKRD
jgi:HD-GYP domain-containing protein (c-di-GMP phosphodiesterase class II)/serine/threonine protein phosphatase PrpC